MDDKFKLLVEQLDAIVSQVQKDAQMKKYGTYDQILKDYRGLKNKLIKYTESLEWLSELPDIETVPDENRGRWSAGTQDEIGKYSEIESKLLPFLRRLHEIKMVEPIVKKDVFDGRIKAFISYSTFDKIKAAVVKVQLRRFGIDGFLAHEDIQCSEEWKEKITQELLSSHVFIPLLSTNFTAKPDWTFQECGIAYILSRQKPIKIIPLKLDDTLPQGVINSIQGKSFDQLFDNLIRPITDVYPEKMIPYIIDNLSGVRDFRTAEAIMSLLIPHYKKMKDVDIIAFAKNSIKNAQVWDASLCAREYIPMFIDLHKKNIDSDLLVELESKISWVKNFE
jgi:hypothetical protein